MELCIENFTSDGNNLMYRKEWEDFQHENCQSKTRARMENRVHYNRIVEALTDNRSIDVLNDASLKNVKKMDSREFISSYIQENSGTLSVQQMAEGVAIALDIPVRDPQQFRRVYDAVMEQMQYINDTTMSMLRAPRRIDISIDTKDVAIQATQEGVTASTNPFSLDAIPSVRRDDETGELAVVHWDGDNQVANRGFNTGGFANSGLTDSGDRLTDVPSQFSVPTRLPPLMTPVVFNRSALPDTTQLPFQVDPSLVIENVNAPRNVPSPVEYDGLKELFVPRTTYIRTFAKETDESGSQQLYDAKKDPLMVKTYMSPSTKSGVTLKEIADAGGQTNITGTYPNEGVYQLTGRRGGATPYLTKNVVGGLPSGRPFGKGAEANPMLTPEKRAEARLARQYSEAGMTTRETNTLLTGEGGYLNVNPKGRPENTGMGVSRTASGAQILSPLMGMPPA